MTIMDAYTTEARLCDDTGVVSDVHVEQTNPFDPELTYRKQLNNLRGHTGLPPFEGPAFRCTGSAHLAREHIRCTNPIHALPVHEPANPLGYIVVGAES